MLPAQTLEEIKRDELVRRVQDLRRRKYRLVAISATRLAEDLELTYSFDLESALLSLRLNLSLDQARVPSISSVYWCAFLYENEIHDLFGLEVDDMQVDFHGKLYQTAVKFPFGARKTPPEQPKKAPASSTESQVQANRGVVVGSEDVSMPAPAH